MLDIITIGSASVDIFISSKSKSIELLRHNRHEEVCMPIGGKILIDYMHQDTGGGGTNTAVAFSRLGFKTAWLGKIGSDINSKHILEQMKKEKVKFIGKTEHGKSTGFSIIIIGIEKDRTILSYKGINDELSEHDIDFKKLNAKWIYMGSMLGKSFDTCEKIAEFAKKKRIPIAFNPSIYLAQKGTKGLQKIISACKLLILNKEEAQAITGKKKEINTLLKELQKNIPIVVITDGARGAYAYDGITKYTLNPRKIKVIETTGAGDSFASGFLAGIILKKDIEYALQMGYAEASSVIQHIGAKEKLLTRKKAEELIKKRPCRIAKEKI
ncbi:MAG: carbohydrate kinase family protein [Candidatus Woesearchaeota archaeon]